MTPSFTSLSERSISRRDDRAAREALLAARGLETPGRDDLILGFFDDADRLLATGALAGDIIQGVAVHPDLEGEGAAAGVVTALIKAAAARGIGHLFVYTKPSEAEKFASLGFSRIADARVADGRADRPGELAASLLEWGNDSVARFSLDLAQRAEGRPESAGVVVVNCNPFTRGHRYLIEYAASRVPWLYVLVVQEDRSLFPFEARLGIVRRGTSDLANVDVIPSGPYVISSATFPTYFLKPSGSDARTALYAELDLQVFKRHIAPALRARTRFVGTEPYCATTSAYNARMRASLPLPPYPMEVVEIPRIEDTGEAISASRVRALIKEGKIEDARRLLPAATRDWLSSDAAKPVIEAIRSSNTRH